MDRLQEAIDKLEEEKLIEITIPDVRQIERIPISIPLNFFSNFCSLEYNLKSGAKTKRKFIFCHQEIPENRTIKYNIPGHGEVELQLPDDAQVDERNPCR